MRATAEAQSAGRPKAEAEQEARSPADQVEDLLALYDGDFRQAMLDLLTVAKVRTEQVSFGLVRGRF